MSGYIDYIKKHKRVYLQSLRDDMKARKDPDFFWPTGTQVYVGKQGSGKTISAVKHLHALKDRYPKSIIVSNLKLEYFKAVDITTKEQLITDTDQMREQSELCSKYYIKFDTMEQLAIALVTVNNDRKGVIYLIDEIHTYFNALESKNIPMYIFTEISQQRKQRKLIIGTSQLFLRMAKPLREQCDNLIICNTYFGILTTQVAYDGMSLDQDYSGNLIGNRKKTGWFFHTRKLRSAFDTFQKVVSGAEQYENTTRLEIRDKKVTKI